MISRRQYLQTIGITTATLATAGVVSADHRAVYEDQPEYVDLVYDQTVLETYNPYMVLRTLDIKPTDVYGWVATSTERETNMACYWVYYVSQQGATSADSHQTDREPVYVEYDPDTGNVQSVHVDGYHYMLRSYPSVELEGETHPTLHVVNPWHFYRETTEVGETLTVEDMHEKYGPWIDNGWNVHRRSVVDPWTVTSRGHWWPDAVGSVSPNAVYWGAMLDVARISGSNIGGAEEADL